MEHNRCERCKNNLCARKVPIFASLSHEDMRKIVNMTGHINYKKGEYICHEGDTSAILFILNEGKVKLSKVNREGKEQILRILSDGSFFGEYYLFSDYEPYNFSAIALSDVKICTLTKKDMDELLKDHPEISHKIMIEISKRLIQTENLVQNLSTTDTDSKVAYVLMELAQKYGVRDGEEIQIEIPINREEMANYAGVTRETISRKLSSFINDGLIEAKGNKIIILKQPDRLQELI